MSFCVEHEQSFITSGPDRIAQKHTLHMQQLFQIVMHLFWLAAYLLKV